MSITKFLTNELYHIYRKSKSSDFVLVQDNSALNVWGECNRKFLYRILLSLRQPEEKPAITFGKALHKFLELYHSGRYDFKTCFEGFVRIAIADNSKITVTRQESINVNDIQEYSMEFGFLLCRNYAETHPVEREYFGILNDANNEPYLETGFAIDLPNGTIIGLIDGIGEVVSTHTKIVIDHKSTKHNLNQTWFSDFNPNNQVSTYLYAASEYFGEWITTALINAVRVKDYKRGEPEDTKTKLFGRIETSRTPEQLEQRMRHANYQLKQIQQSIDVGLDGFPMMTHSCITKFGECEYRRLCLSKSDAQLQALAEATFKVEKWTPYEILDTYEVNKIVDIDVNLDDQEKNKVEIMKREDFVKEHNINITDKEKSDGNNQST